MASFTSSGGIPTTETGFIGAEAGRRFAVTHQAPGTAITGQTSFVATTPTFLLRNNASTRRVVLRSIDLAQTGVVAGGVINVTVTIDTADRLSTGGTSVTPQNMNTGSAIASAVTGFLTNPTATAAGGGTRYIVNTSIPASIGTVANFGMKDAVILGTTSSLLIYTWALVAAPSWYFIIEWEEIV